PRARCPAPPRNAAMRDTAACSAAAGAGRRPVPARPGDGRGRTSPSGVTGWWSSEAEPAAGAPYPVRPVLVEDEVAGVEGRGEVGELLRGAVERVVVQVVRDRDVRVERERELTLQGAGTD